MFTRLLFGRLPGRTTIRMASTSAKKLSGKVAVVTASTEGIGYAIAEKLGQDGAKVVVSSRRQKNVDEAVKKMQEQNIEVFGTVCHVAKSEDRSNLIKQTVDKYGGIDILVSNAAVNPTFGPILDCSEEAWSKIFDVNVKATFLLIKEAVPHMEKRGGGSVIIVSSVVGFQPMPMLGAYSVSKSALLGLTKALVPDLQARNIRVNGIAPGVIKTKFSQALYYSRMFIEKGLAVFDSTPMLWTNEEIMKTTLSNVPMGRLGQPYECAGVASFLASDESSYIMGETIMVTGGIPARV